MTSQEHTTERTLNQLALMFSALELEMSHSEVKSSFHEFIKQAWPAIEGGVTFIDSWHIQAIAEHLEACYSRDIKKLLINIGLNYRSGANANWKHEFGLILAKIWHFSKNYLSKNSRKSFTHSLSVIYLEDDFISQKLLA